VAAGPYIDFPTKIGKLMMDNGYEALDAIAVTEALSYIAYLDKEIIKGKAGIESVYRWQLWKRFVPELEDLEGLERG